MKVQRGFIWLIALLFCATLFGQYTAQEINGFVRDSTGAVVPSVNVSVINTATGQVRSTTSNETGFYAVTNLPIGSYTVSVEAAGFKKFVKTNVEVTLQATVSVDVALEIGQVTDSVTVAADAVMVEASTGEVGRLVSGTQVAELQLNGRNYAQLITTIPGVSGPDRSGFALAQGNKLQNFVVGGAHGDLNAWNLEGVDNRDNGGGGSGFVNIDPEAIAEFRVVTSNYSAEFGQNIGATVNIAMKSGTRSFHGTAYEFVRNDAFDARAFNALTKPTLRFNNFGWNLGGPVYIPGKFNSDKSKLFFFGGMQYKLLRQSTPVTWQVPTAALKSGDFSSLPSSQWPKDPTTGIPYANGKIPTASISPNGARLLQNYPAPNFTGTGGNFVFAPVGPFDINQYFVKADYIATSKHQFSVTFAHESQSTIWGIASGATGDVGVQLTEFDRNVPNLVSTARWTYIAGPTLVNTFQFSLSGNIIRQDNFRPNPVFVTDVTRKGQGLTFPTIYGLTTTIPSLAVSGYNTLNAPMITFNNFDRIFQWKDDVSKRVGNHTLRFGTMIERSRKNQDSPGTLNGGFAFQSGHPTSTGNAVADALIGNFYSYSESSTDPQGWYRFTTADFYLQDNWRVSSRLTLDLGVRYSYIQPQHTVLGNATIFSPAFYNAAKAVTILPSNGQIVTGTGDPYNGLAICGDSFPSAANGRVPAVNDPSVKALFRGVPSNCQNTDYGAIGPRIGFAYDLTGKQRTVLRGGWGLFYEQVPGNFIFNRVTNPPFVQSQTIYDGNVENPSGGSARVFPTSLSSGDTHIKLPRVQSFSLGVQHKLTNSMMLDVSYVGKTGWDLFWTRNINQLAPGTIQKNPGVNVSALRPYRGYGNISQTENGANMNYNSLQTLLKWQMSGGLQLQAAYTYSHAIDNAFAYSSVPMDSYNGWRDRSDGAYDRRHIFTFNYVYPLPFFRDQRMWYGKVLGGWQISGLTMLETGLPFIIGIQPDQAGIGGGSTQRPNVIGDWQAGAGTWTAWFNKLAFALPAPGTFGNMGRYVIHGPGANNWDASLHKRFKIGEQVNLDFRAEFFNVPNHLSVNTVNGTLGAGNFGQVTSALDPRILQFGLKLMF